MTFRFNLIFLVSDFNPSLERQFSCGHLGDSSSSMYVRFHVRVEDRFGGKLDRIQSIQVKHFNGYGLRVRLIK
jgi:hypothetical protein